MSFADHIISEINKFRINPKSIQQRLQIFKLGLSRLRATDPFLTEIQKFIDETNNMFPMRPLHKNDILCKVARKEIEIFATNEEMYDKFIYGDNLRGIIPDYYLKENCCLIADVGADEPGTFVNKILVNKIDKEKIGRKFLTQPKYTQIGIATAIKNSENYILIILAENQAKMRSNIPLPEGDLTELKQAFDFFDIYKRGEIYPKIVLENLIELGYDKSNPQLVDIIEGFLINGENDIIDFPIFANHIVREISDKRTNDGLRIIFELFVDDKNEDTISILNMKKIVSELKDDKALKKIDHMLNIKDNVNARLNFNQFYHYMKRTYASDEIAVKVQKIQRILGKNPSKALETIVETNESSISDLRSTGSGKKNDK
jgi:Ca2+-binding EF-hand superfamily protein